MTARALPGEQGSGKPGVGGAGGDAAPPPASLVQRLRDVHLQMVDAVLAGDGLVRVAELAAAAADGPVAIVVPRIGVAVLAPEGGEAAGQLPALKRYVADRLCDRPAEVPAAVAAEVPIAAGDEALASELLAEVRKRLAAAEQNRARNMAMSGRPAAPTDPRGNLRWDLAWIASAASPF